MAVSLEEQPIPEGYGPLTGKIDGVPQGAIRRGELAEFVIFTVIRQIGLGNYAVDPPSGDHGRAVEEHVVDFQGQADDREDGQIPAGGEDLGQSGQTGIEKPLLMEEVLARVGREAELRKNRHHGLTPRSLLHERDGAPRVEGRVRDLHLRHSRREANKTMIVQVEEFLAVHLPINGASVAPSTGISRRSLPLNLASLVPAGTGCVKEQCGRFS